jgi:DNA-binding XRE family transcriptional regulator
MKKKLDGEEIKRLRGSLSQKAFADLLDLQQNTISAIELGKIEPTSETWMKIGKVVPYPDNFRCWKRAGMDEQQMLSAAGQVLKERGIAPMVGEFLQIPCLKKTAEGTQPLNRLFPLPVQFAPNPLSTVCLIVDESAATARIPAGDHIVLDESEKDAHNLNRLRKRIILTESSVPVPGSLKNGIFAMKFGSLYMGRLDFHAEPIVWPNDTGIFSINWVAVLDAVESFTWRISDPGMQIGQSTYLPGKAPRSAKEDKTFQEAAHRQALSGMRTFDSFKILGEVVAWFRAPE